MPFYFNEFLMIVLPIKLNVEINSTDWKECCSSLFKFYEWFKKKEYSTVELIYEKNDLVNA